MVATVPTAPSALKLPPASKRFLVAVAIAAAALVSLRYLGTLDVRFHPASANGAKGLLRYLVGDYVGAAAAYRAHHQAVARETGDANSMWHALLARDLATAKRLAQAAVGRGYSRDAWLTLAEIALWDDQPAEALRFTTQVLERERDQYDALLLSAAAHSRQRAWSDAIADLGRALRHGRIESRITSWLWALETTGRLRGLPAREQPLCLLAQLHRYLRIFDPWNGYVAIRYAERAVATGDHPAEAWLVIAIVRNKQDKPDASFQAALKALDVNPSQPEALRWAAYGYSARGDVANELRMLQRAVDAAPADPYYLPALLHVLTEKVGDFESAKIVGERALRAGIGDGELYRRLGYIYYSLGHYQTSLDYYAQAVALEPGRADSQGGLGWALQAVGRSAEGLARFERAVQLAPYDTDAHVALARAYHRAKRHTEAITSYERGIDLAMRTGNANFWDFKDLCDLYRRVGALERAEACLTRLISFQPGAPITYRRLAEVRENLRLERAAP